MLSKSKSLLWLGLSTLAASSQAVEIDDYNDGAFDSGAITPTSSYIQTTSAPGAWGGGRTHVVYGQNAGSATARVGVDPSAGVYTARMDNGVTNGFTEIVYGRPFIDFQGDLRPNTHINVTIESTTQPLQVLVGLRGPASATLASFTSSFQQIAPTSTPVTLSFNLGNGFDQQNYNHLFGQAQQLFIDFSNPGSGNGTSAVDVRVSGVQAVPEPLTLGVMATGVALLGLRRRRKS